MECVRIIFSKKGRVKYTSHLDVMRCFERAVRRAKIPLWYTEGFNPHPYLNFLQPLPLGVEGMNEPLDIRIEGVIENNEIMQRLNSVLPVGIAVTKVYVPYMKSGDIAYAEYDIAFEKADGFAEKLIEAMESGTLICEKMGKVHGRKRIKQVDISGSIKKYSVSEKNDCIEMNVILPSGNEKNVNPVHLLDAIKKYLNNDIVPLNIERQKLLDMNLMDFE